MNLRNSVTPVSFRPIQLLFLAAIFHLIFTTIVFAIGRFQLLPGTFDSNGTAISFASDAGGLLEDTVNLSNVLRRGELKAWFNLPYSFHVKLYSVGFVLLRPLLGLNILTAEPLNLLCYLGILILVYKLGVQAFDSRTGLLAAIMVGLWPSLLLHTTQLLKDSLFILGMLALIFVLTHLLTRRYSYRSSFLKAVVGGSLVALLWKTRSNLGVMTIGTVLLGALILVVRQFQLKTLLISNSIAMALLITLSAGAMLFLPVFRTKDNPRHHEKQQLSQTSTSDLHWWQWAEQIGNIRQRFIESYPGSSSNVDSDVQINTTWSLVRYLPRATAIGFLAPFPKMWFENANSVGSIGRKLSGVETLFMYGIECFAVLGLWQGRRLLSVWFLFSLATMGMLALGLVVVNIGTLYRLRYPFLILLMILAARPISQMLPQFKARRMRQDCYSPG